LTVKGEQQQQEPVHHRNLVVYKLFLKGGVSDQIKEKK